ncbi:MAG: capsid cement protein [Planctomycetota bacterium]|nr:capsid cement protein [Planctomycetota bacterium]
MSYYGITERYSPDHTIPAEASETLYARRFIKLGANQSEMDLCDAAGEQAHGVLTSHNLVETISDGDDISYVYFGDVKMDCGGTFAIGDDITTDNTGQAIKAETSTHKILGVALTAGADGSIGCVRINLPGRDAVA